MNEYVCTDAVVPLRTGPSHRAEMGSQILMGEKFIILDKAACWTKIEMIFDGYSGWVDNDHFILSRPAGTGKSMLLTEGIEAMNPNGESLSIYPGSELYDLKDDGKGFTVGYAYDIWFNALKAASRGSHEIRIGYEVDLFHKKRMLTPRYF